MLHKIILTHFNLSDNDLFVNILLTVTIVRKYRTSFYKITLFRFFIDLFFIKYKKTAYIVCIYQTLV